MTTNLSVASPRRILIATVVALLVAVLVLVTAVLPAEYGVDPLGTGRALGLTSLAGTPEEPSMSGEPSSVAVFGTNNAQSGTMATDVFTVELRPFEGVEYKYRVEQGGGLVYAWTASAPVSYDFHGEPDGAPARYSESYGTGDAAAAAGVFLAPKPGIHGWFWENTGKTRITVTLRSSGFFTASTEYRDGERIHKDFGGHPQPKSQE